MEKERFALVMGEKEKAFGKMVREFRIQVSGKVEREMKMKIFIENIYKYIYFLFFLKK